MFAKEWDNHIKYVRQILSAYLAYLVWHVHDKFIT